MKQVKQLNIQVMKSAAYGILMFVFIAATIMCYFKDGQEKPEDSRTYNFKRFAVGSLFFIILISLIYWL